MNEINIRQRSEKIFEALDNGAIIARLEIDEKGKEKSLWVHEGYKSCRSYIENVLRDEVRKVDF